MSIKSWFDLPVKVFIDTQIYINESYNFNEKGTLSFFRKQVLDGNVIHLTSEIVVREVEKHIMKDVAEAVCSFNKAVDDRRFAIFRDKDCAQLQKLNESDVVTEAITIFKKYLADTMPFMLHMDTINVSSVVSDYFDVKSPFGMKKDKKSEFPDAFNLNMLRKYAEHNRPVIIVSGDGDFSDEEDIICYQKLGDLLDAINSQNEITHKVKAFLTSKRQFIFDEVEAKLLDGEYVFEVDGTDTDRKGYQHGVEYDEVELLSFSAKSIKNMGVLNIDLSDRTITIILGCMASMDFSCTFTYETMGDFSTSGTIKETHNVTIPVIINTSFEDDEGNESFDIINIEIDISDVHQLNQYTLKEGSRVRTDDPNCYWDDREIINNPCPECGREMTFETEGGNGFCVNCAPNH